ncbi:MAG: hypothetical protein ACKO4U_10420 [Caldilinea sp.]
MRTHTFLTAWALLLTPALLLGGCGSEATPTSANLVEPVAEAAFNEWATNNGEPYRDVQVTEESNDGFFATVRVFALFRPSADAPWQEREAYIECRQVGGSWQCDRDFRFVLSPGEVERTAEQRHDLCRQLPDGLRPQQPGGVVPG